jgi:hypothetical protein
LLRSVLAWPLAGKAPSVFETRHKETMLLWAPILYSKFLIIASPPDRVGVPDLRALSNSEDSSR